MSFGQFGFNQVQISFGGLTWTGGMAPGVSTITAIDSNFNGDEFLSYAQGAFWRVMQAREAGRLADIRPLVSDSMYSNLQAMGTKGAPHIETIQYATVYDARHDHSWDTVTVRFAAKTSAKKKNDFVEDWTFQRPATHGQAPLPSECPSCGAPLTLDDNGGCKYCRVAVGGAHGGWKLVRTGPPSTGTNQAAAGVGPRRRNGARGWVAFWVIFMVLMTVVLPIGIWYAIDQSTGDVFDVFGSSSQTDGGPVVSATSGSGTGTGTATFSGAITGAIDGSVVTVGGTSGPCTSRATDVSGFTFLHQAEDGAGSQTITVTMQYPAGQKGVGTFDLATTPFTLTAAYAANPDPAAGGAPSAQSWSPGAGSTATFELTSADAGHLVFADLVPAAPAAAVDDALGQPLSGVIDFAC